MARNVLLITRLSMQNAGNEALSKELIKYFSSRLSHAEIRMIDRYPRYFGIFTTKSLAQSPIESFDALASKLAKKFVKQDSVPPPIAAVAGVRLDETARELTGPLREIKRKLAVRRRLAALGLIERSAVFVSVTACASSELVVWNPAGEMIRGSPDHVMRLLLLMRIAQLSGRKTAVINHSIEIDDVTLRTLVAHVYSNLDYIGVRDARTADVVASFGLPLTRIHEAPDLVFLVSRTKGKDAAIDTPQGAIGLAINGFAARQGQDEWESFTNGLSKIQRPVLLLSNAVNHDRDFANKLAKSLPNATVIEHQPGYEDLRAYYRRCSVLVSSRLHASILALCEDVPVVSIEPSIFKLTAVFEQLGYPIATARLQQVGWSDRVLSNVMHCLGSERPRIIQAGQMALAEQCARIDSAYDKLFRLVTVEKSELVDLPRRNQSGFRLDTGSLM
jgi:polysaccharide pyruvyl transferase WcaK-like protein